jgi:hypothetical protein
MERKLRHQHESPASDGASPPPNWLRLAGRNRRMARVRWQWLGLSGEGHHLHTPEGHVASLSVANPWAPRLDETVVAGEGSFWWGWGQRITPVADIKEAAGVIGHVLSAGASST